MYSGGVARGFGLQEAVLRAAAHLGISLVLEGKLLALWNCSLEHLLPVSCISRGAPVLTALSAPRS